jgi:hypothetical protein
MKEHTMTILLQLVGRRNRQLADFQREALLELLSDYWVLTNPNKDITLSTSAHKEKP